MDTYTDNRPLFLTDVSLTDFNDRATVPVIEGWQWEVSGDGKGCLRDPAGRRHCSYDLMSGQITYEPDGDTISAPGLTPALVQEMGERYADEVMFTKAEQQAYKEHVRLRDNTQKVHNRTVRDTLKGVIQLEHKDGQWLAYVDIKKAQELTGIDAPRVCSLTEGVDLFNRMSETLHASPLKDPTGYMALDGNMYAFLQQEYRDQYENALQGIDNQILDGTGHGVVNVLDHLSTVVRKDISEYMPEGEFFGNLRFVKATPERQDAARNFVRNRVSKTLTYEKKRSYEESTLKRTHEKLVQAGESLRESLSDMGLPAQECGEQL